MNSDPSPARSVPGLVLTGGGARAAYQVGVLKALAHLLPGRAMPFGIVLGTSAGAVAASVIAARARRWQRAVAAIESVWANFHVDQVFEVGGGQMLLSGMHWLASLVSGGLLVAPPRSLFDNAPLRRLLGRSVSWTALRRGLKRGDLSALALCATGYASARSVAFFDGHPSLSEWERRQHVGRRTELTLNHLMASLAVPFLFEPELIGSEYYGDGAMRQLSPLSPAAYLGADRLLVIGVRAAHEAGLYPPLVHPAAPPGPGQILGYALDNLFMDQVYSDLEAMHRVNQLVKVAPALVPGSRRIETLLITPSEDPREVAARHFGSLPRSLRILLRVAGATHGRGSQLASYLMFEASYTRELIAMGYADAMARGSELRDFLGRHGQVDLASAAGGAG